MRMIDRGTRKPGTVGPNAGPEIRIVDELPRTPSGKVQKFLLRRQLRERFTPWIDRPLDELEDVGAQHDGSGRQVPTAVAVEGVIDYMRYVQADHLSYIALQMLPSPASQNALRNRFFLNRPILKSCRSDCAVNESLPVRLNFMSEISLAPMRSGSGSVSPNPTRALSALRCSV